ncbi:regulator of chromosome condensation family protein [Cryptosporidium andersoni]|uniref:Regulator of chromosome condensation family protein n=1 Tax=Cryptosporidium andersoni TaxID=117008 RepID=A0A1J4MW53_9CRYT|nr:regulator of chromosome condensation family protein [Cryptosporidium andersoni]
MGDLVGSPTPGVSDFIKKHIGKESIGEYSGDLFGGHTFSRAACTLDHYFIIGKYKNKPQLYAWGENTNNVLGFGIDTDKVDLPTRVPFFSIYDVFQVSCGYLHTAVLIKSITESGGKVYTMGLGNRGRLGYTRSDTEFGLEEEYLDKNESWYSISPCIVKFPSNTKISRICCGANHTLALSDNGNLYSWGVGQFGCLGTGSTEDVFFPTKIEISNNSLKVQHIAAGSRHSLCCTENGNLFAWGSNANGRLGIGGVHGIKLKPTIVQSMLPYHVCFVVTGEAHSGCIDRMGIVFTWGNGSNGQLGHGLQLDCPIPRKVHGISSIPFVQLAFGAFISMGLTQSGDVYIWGSKQHEIFSTPTKIKSFKSAICHIACGPYISFAIDVRSIAYSWNNRIIAQSIKNRDVSNIGEELVLKRMNNPNPVVLPFFQGSSFVDDAIFLMGFCLVDSNGNKMNYTAKELGGIYCTRRIYGPNNDSSGLGSLIYKSLPPNTVRQIACGEAHNILLTYGGCVYTWGDNSYGQLGIGSLHKDLGEASNKNKTFVTEPNEVKFSGPIRRVACGYWHTLCCDYSGNCFTWGRGDYGQLGTGAICNMYEPVGIISLNNVVDVYGGELYSACIIATGITRSKDLDTINSGDLWIWGDGDFGKLGLGDDINGKCIAAPRYLNLGYPIVKVSLGTVHTLALTANGNLITWGAGYYGRLGVGTTNNHNRPIIIKFPIADVRISDIAVGADHSMAVSVDGDLWIWGKASVVLNETDVLQPHIFAKLESATGVPKVYSVYAHADVSYAITNTGELWTWGPESLDTQKKRKMEKKDKNYSHTGRTELVLLPGSVAGVSGGSCHSMCLLVTGEVLSWGSTESGRLGQNTTKSQSYVSSPTMVIPRWNIPNSSLDISKSLAASYDTDENTIKNMFNINEEVTTIEDLEKFMDSLDISITKYARGNVSFEYIQKLLQKEDPRSKTESIQLLEEDLIVLFASHLTYFAKMKQKEERLQYLTFLAEVQLRRLILVILKLTDQSIKNNTFNKYRNNNDVLLNHSVLRYMNLLEYIISIIRLQPLYIINILLQCEIGEEFRSIINLIYGIYPINLSSSSIFSSSNFNGLFDTSLMLEVIGEALCKRELQMIESTVYAFFPENSRFLYFFSSVVLRGQELRNIIKYLLDIGTPSSLVALLTNMPPEILLCLDSKCLAQYLGLSLHDETLPRLYADMIKFVNLALMTGIADNINQKMIFPKIMERLLYKVWKLIYSMDIPNYNPLYDKKQQKDLSVQQPLLRLILYGVIIPILEQCNVYCTYYYIPVISDLRIYSCIQTIANALKFYLNGTIQTMQPSNGFLWINIIANTCNIITMKLAEMVNSQRDDTDLSLTYMAYNTQYTLKSGYYNIVLNLADVMILVNCIQKYKYFLQLNIVDPLICSIEYIEKRDHLSVPFFTKEYIDLVKSKNSLGNNAEGGVYITIKLNPRWIANNNDRGSNSYTNYTIIDKMYSKLNQDFKDQIEEVNEEENCMASLDDSMMFCPITKVGTSQSLLPRYEANKRSANGIAEYGLFIRYSEIPDRRRLIEEGLYICPTITARSIYELLESFDEYIDQYKRKESDSYEYQQLTKLLEVKRVTDDLQSTYCDSILPLLKWISLDMYRRLKHRAYLEHLMDIQIKLMDKQVLYENELQEWEDKIEQSVVDMTIWGYTDPSVIKLLRKYGKSNSVMDKLKNTLLQRIWNSNNQTEKLSYIGGNNEEQVIYTEIVKSSISLPSLWLKMGILISAGIILVNTENYFLKMWFNPHKFYNNKISINNWNICLTCTPTLGIECIVTVSQVQDMIKEYVDQRTICKFYISPRDISYAKLSNISYTKIYANGLIEINLPNLVNFIYFKI